MRSSCLGGMHDRRLMFSSDPGVGDIDVYWDRHGCGCSLCAGVSGPDVRARTCYAGRALAGGRRAPPFRLSWISVDVRRVLYSLCHIFIAFPPSLRQFLCLDDAKAWMPSGDVGRQPRIDGRFEYKISGGRFVSFPSLPLPLRGVFSSITAFLPLHS